MIWWHEPTGYASYDGKEREETLIGGYSRMNTSSWAADLPLTRGVRIERDYIKTGVDKYSPTQATNKILKNEWSKPVYGASIGSGIQA